MDEIEFFKIVLGHIININSKFPLKKIFKNPFRNYIFFLTRVNTVNIKGREVLKYLLCIFSFYPSIIGFKNALLFI